MTRRYGRNQRRRAKEEAARLALENLVLAARAARAERDLRNAKELAMEELLSTRLPIDQFAEKLRAAMLVQLQPHLVEAAEKVFAALDDAATRRRRPSFVELRLRRHHASDAKPYVLSGYIPEIHWNIAFGGRVG